MKTLHSKMNLHSKIYYIILKDQGGENIKTRYVLVIICIRFLLLVKQLFSVYQILKNKGSLRYH